LKYAAIKCDLVAPMLVNQRCHGYHFEPHSLRVVLMSAPSMKLIGPPGTELRHILTVHIMCPCDLHLWPIFSEIGSCDPEVVMNILAYLEVYRRFRFWNMKP